MINDQKITQAKNLHQGEILSKPNVIGVGTGLKESNGHMTDEVCVVALVRRKVPKAALSEENMVPRDLEGVSTDVIEVGLLRAAQSRTDRWRPAPGGVSLGHYKVTAGTLGATVRDRASGDRLILSNNHVMANGNEALIGDQILQPGALDGGRRPEDTFATLERFQRIRFSTQPPTCDIANTVVSLLNSIARLLGSSHRVETFRTDPAASNLIDAALARPLDEAQLLDAIEDIGVIGGTAPAQLGMSVRKSGRTTGFTVGTVTVLDATVDIDYNGQTARFENQILTTPMSEPGDSGSLLVSGDSLLAVGLLFAGSNQATIHNPIQTVLDTLEVVI